MRGLLRLRNLRGDCRRFVTRQRPTGDPPIETLAIDQFEHEDIRAVRFLKAVDRADMWMVQRREHLRFSAKTQASVRVPCRNSRAGFRGRRG